MLISNIWLKVYGRASVNLQDMWVSTENYIVSRTYGRASVSLNPISGCVTRPTN